MKFRYHYLQLLLLLAAAKFLTAPINLRDNQRRGGLSFIFPSKPIHCVIPSVVPQRERTSAQPRISFPPFDIETDRRQHFRTERDRHPRRRPESAWSNNDRHHSQMSVADRIVSSLAPADNNAQTIQGGISASTPAAAASFEEDRYAVQTGGLLPDIRTVGQSFRQEDMSLQDDSFEEEGRPPYLHAMIAGGVGGSTGDMLMHSLDTVKTRQQGDPHIPPKYTSLGSSYYKILRQEGVQRGLYGGWIPALGGSLPGTMMFFGTYEWSKRFLIDHGVQQHLAYLTAGFLGDLAGSIVYVPSEVLKTRLQLQGRYNNPYFKSGYNYRGTVDAARTIVRHEGPAALFHGYQATLARDLPFSALQFMFWEQFHAWARTYKQSRDVGVPLELLTGGLAGSLAGIMTCPLDVVKTRLQTQVHPDLLPKEMKPVAKGAAHASTSKSQTRHISTSSPSTHTPRPGAVNLQTSSVIEGLKVIYQTEGISGWFRGVGPRGVWTFIQSGTMLFLYQRILKSLETWDPPVEEQERAI